MYSQTETLINAFSGRTKGLSEEEEGSENWGKEKRENEKRGGNVFPTVLVAVVCVALLSLYLSFINSYYHTITQSHQLLASTDPILSHCTVCKSK